MTEVCLGVSGQLKSLGHACCAGWFEDHGRGEEILRHIPA